MDCFVTDYKLDCPKDAVRIVLEDSIMQKGRPVTAGSKMLENFISPIDAAVVTRLESAGVKILGKTKMDEFGIDGLSGGLSGAVVAVAEGASEFALCNDFSGKVRRQAAERGLYYIHPTYGTVSRYGLIPAVSSMDQIGVICKNPAEGFKLLSVISGNDPRDGAMYPDKEYSHCCDKTGLKLGIPENVMALTAEKDKAAVLEFAKGLDTVSFELEYFSVYSQVMHILCSAELSNNISRYDGVKFGYRADGYRSLDELYKKSRTEAFGLDAKLYAIMGAIVLSQENYTRYYDKAMRIRRLIKDSLRFDKYDVIAMPSWPDADVYERGAVYVLPQLAGLPSVTVSFVGGVVQLIADAKNESALFSVLEGSRS